MINLVEAQREGGSGLCLLRLLWPSCRFIDCAGLAALSVMNSEGYSSCAALGVSMCFRCRYGQANLKKALAGPGCPYGVSFYRMLPCIREVEHAGLSLFYDVACEHAGAAIAYVQGVGKALESFRVSEI